MESRSAFLDLLRAAPSPIQPRLLNLLSALQFQSDLMSGATISFSLAGDDLKVIVKTKDGKTLTGTVCPLA